MGDGGARLLAKALQINTRLRKIILDRNNISLQGNFAECRLLWFLSYYLSGYQDITYALQSNYSMKHIPFPTFDLQPAMKTSPDRVDSIIRQDKHNFEFFNINYKLFQEDAGCSAEEFWSKRIQFQTSGIQTHPGIPPQLHAAGSWQVECSGPGHCQHCGEREQVTIYIFNNLILDSVPPVVIPSAHILTLHYWKILILVSLQFIWPVYLLWIPQPRLGSEAQA